MMRNTLLKLVGIILFLLTLPSFAQSENEKPVLQAPLFDNLSSYHRPVSTGIPLAQRFFDQGLILFYGFEWGESIRSFKEATRLDPVCGMCYWGLALALGNKINAPINGHEYSDGKAAIQKALSLSDYETPVEKEYIKALSLRYQHAPKVVTQAGARSVVRAVEHYNLDLVLSIGYRVNSKKATQFRQWATSTLKTHILL